MKESLFFASTPIVSNEDATIMANLLTGCPAMSLTFYVDRIKKIFGDRITIQHYMALSHLIGFLEGTEQTYHSFIINNQPCQRAN